ncbi:LarC family nickel insertion protein [Streptomyces sp. HPF1205]|uniref:LarC family nickel insertion protein n=1 Tax=Streptomyces sp. HPF1205 TaxID=2873262 RepID=UPI001CED71B9|nr:LarC family nickel insertion protein [Streptomyces sp. HPF1205]
MFYRLNEFGPEAGYTVLLPTSASRVWRVRGTVVVPQVALVLVPAPDRCELAEDGPWWVVPPDGAGTLCTPALLASLLARWTALEGDSRA